MMTSTSSRYDLLIDPLNSLYVFPFIWLSFLRHLSHSLYNVLFFSPVEDIIPLILSAFSTPIIFLNIQFLCAFWCAFILSPSPDKTQVFAICIVSSLNVFIFYILRCLLIIDFCLHLYHKQVYRLRQLLAAILSSMFKFLSVSRPTFVSDP